MNFRKTSTKLQHYLLQIKHILVQSSTRNTRKRCWICSDLTKKTPEQCQWYHSGVFVVNFEHIFLPFFEASIFHFEHVYVLGKKQAILQKITGTRRVTKTWTFLLQSLLILFHSRMLSSHPCVPKYMSDDGITSQRKSIQLYFFTL